jgi:hypothetical protein
VMRKSRVLPRSIRRALRSTARLGGIYVIFSFLFCGGLSSGLWSGVALAEKEPLGKAACCSGEK